MVVTTFFWVGSRRRWIDLRVGQLISFWRWWKTRRTGGRRRGAKRPEKREPEAFASGSRFLFGGRGAEGPPRPPNAAAPRVSAPGFLLPGFIRP